MLHLQTTNLNFVCPWRVGGAAGVGTESCSPAMKTAVVPVLTSKVHADNEEMSLITARSEEYK